MINCYDVLQLTVFTWLYSTHNLIIHPILVLTAFITAYLCSTCYFSLISVYIIIICSHIICTCIFPFYFTHSLGRFLMTMDLHIQIWCLISLIRCSMRPGMLWGAGVSLYLFWYSSFSFYSCRFCSSLILYHYQLLLHSLFIYYHVWMLICDIAAILIYRSRFL